MPFDIRQLARRDRLRSGDSYVWSWSRGDDPVGSVGVQVEADRIVLSYVRSRDGESQSVRCSLWVAPCNGGYGPRRMFLCPCCRARVAVVYFGGNAFACRKCLRLAYASEAEDKMGRLWRKQSKVERRLIDAGSRYDKPKGMHWLTFNRLVDKANQIEEEKDYLFAASCGPLFRRLGILT